MKPARIASIVAKWLAFAWIGILILGIFGKLYGFVHHQGWWAGFESWRDWFDPLNPLTFIVRLVELSPALGLLFLANWLESRPSAR